MDKTINIDWNNLGFNYPKTDCSYISYWKDGNLDNGKLIEDNVLKLSEASTALHYGQQCFEGLRAYRTKIGNGGTLYLRPLVIGVRDNIGVKSANEYIFIIFCTPVSTYFKGGMTPCKFMINDYDRLLIMVLELLR